jgi:hypothetical protein
VGYARGASLFGSVNSGANIISLSRNAFSFIRAPRTESKTDFAIIIIHAADGQMRLNANSLYCFHGKSIIPLGALGRLRTYSIFPLGLCDTRAVCKYTSQNSRR